MAYDERLAARIRKVLARHKAVHEIKMFGGLCFMVRGNMCCGVHKTRLMVRVGPKRYEKALTQPHARPMDITGHPLKGFVFVGAKGYEADPSLRKWIKQSVDFSLSLPPKYRLDLPGTRGTGWAREGTLHKGTVHLGE